jgi:hypothetical protein
MRIAYVQMLLMSIENTQKISQLVTIPRSIRMFPTNQHLVSSVIEHRQDILPTNSVKTTLVNYLSNANGSYK